MCGWSCAGYWLWVSRHEGGDQLLQFDQNLPYCQVQALALTILGIVGLLVLSLASFLLVKKVRRSPLLRQLS